MGLQTLNPDCTVDDIVIAMERDGACIIRNALSPEDLKELQAETAPWIEQTAEGLDDWSGLKTRRTGGLIARCASVRKIAVNPLIVGAASRYRATAIHVRFPHLRSKFGSLPNGQHLPNVAMEAAVARRDRSTFANGLHVEFARSGHRHGRPRLLHAQDITQVDAGIQVASPFSCISNAMRRVSSQNKFDDDRASGQSPAILPSPLAAWQRLDLQPWDLRVANAYTIQGIDCAGSKCLLPCYTDPWRLWQKTKSVHKPVHNRRLTGSIRG